MKSVTIYKRGNALYINSSSKTTAGVWVGTPPFTKIAADISPSAKGEAILRALHASQEGVPHPTDWKGVIAPLLELAGVRSWATFMKNSECVGLKSDGERLKLIPYRNLGLKGGFEPALADAIDLSWQASPEQIGSALEKLLI